MENEELRKLLAKPTPPEEVKERIKQVVGNRCQLIAYVDARYMQERMNEAFGIGGWQVRYPDAPIWHKRRAKIKGEWVEVETMALKCELVITFGGHCMVHEDYGYVNGPDDEEPLKSAASDGFKRCCVHLGLTHDLYAGEAEWCDYDPVKKKPIRAKGGGNTPAETPATSQPKAQPAPAANEWPAWAEDAGAPADKTCPDCGKPLSPKTVKAKATGISYEVISCKLPCKTVFWKPKDWKAGAASAEEVADVKRPKVDEIVSLWNALGYPSQGVQRVVNSMAAHLQKDIKLGSTEAPESVLYKHFNFEALDSYILHLQEKCREAEQGQGTEPQEGFTPGDPFAGE